MKQYIKALVNPLLNRVAKHVAESLRPQLPSADALADEIAHRLALERFLDGRPDQPPHEMFQAVSDPFWFWLCTEGYRRSPRLRRVLPGMPDENVQLQFTGHSGDSVLREGFQAYKCFRDQYEAHVGPIAQCQGILDFGCGWGRIIRFFIKDVEPSVLWGVDPVGELIEHCRRTNPWVNFETIGNHPPTRFNDATFDIIYSYSVFSHLSEEVHLACVKELARLLKPGGLLMVTTRSREFILHCAEVRKRKDLSSVHPGPRLSASAFPDTEKSLSQYDRGEYCFTQLVFEGDWSYWGDTAISKKYVTNTWTPLLEFVDYIDDRKRYDQNIVVMRKPR